MNDTDLPAALLHHNAITTLVGDRIALAELPQGQPLPALVYSIITSRSTPYLGAWNEPAQGFMRLQLNPLAPGTPEVDAIHAAIESALAWRRGEDVAGHWLILVEPGPYGPWSKDDLTGAWTRPRDYLIKFEA